VPPTYFECDRERLRGNMPTGDQAAHQPAANEQHRGGPADVSVGGAPAHRNGQQPA